MPSPYTIMDLEFGLSQLSGNKALFLRLLQKFADEYQFAKDRIRQLLNDESFDAARLQIHTIKGVAGNMGLNWLQQASTETENALKTSSSLPATLSAFFDALDATLTCIHNLQAKPDTLERCRVLTTDDLTQTAPSPVSREPEEKLPPGLLNALNNNEFIPQQQLEEWLSAFNSEPDRKTRIRDAIDELDYETAIDLLNR